MITLRSLTVASLLCTSVGAQAQRSSFITTLGADTLSFEQFRRDGDTITGDWVTTYGGIMYHHYTIALRPDGTVAHYSLILHRAAGKPEDSVDVTFDRDSLFIRRASDSSAVRRPAARDVFPLFASTIGPLDLVLVHARAAGRDSSMAGVVSVYGPGNIGRAPVVFFGSDSVWFGNPRAPLYASVDRVGHIEGLSARTSTTRTETRRVPDYDLAAVIRHFPDVSANTPILGVPALSPRDTARGSIGGATISIDYGRPAVRGRSVFSHGVLGDTLWRVGANAATQITTTGDLVFGKQRVPPGKYSLWVHVPPDNSSYELIFNRQTGQWGTEHHFDQDLFRVPLERHTNAAPVERLTIQIIPGSAGGVLSIRWSTIELDAPVRRG